MAAARVRASGGMMPVRSAGVQRSEKPPSGANTSGSRVQPTSGRVREFSAIS